MDDEEVTKFLRWKAHKNVLESEKVIKNWVDSYKNDDFFQWIIELKELAEPIGTISVISIDKRVNSCHIGYCIGKKFWNMGYTSEAFSAIISFYFLLVLIGSNLHMILIIHILARLWKNVVLFMRVG